MNTQIYFLKIFVFPRHEHSALSGKVSKRQVLRENFHIVLLMLKELDYYKLIILNKHLF